MRWLKGVGIGVGALVLVLAAALWWLLGTTSGLHFALARVSAMSHGAIAVKSSRGKLAGKLQLDQVAYESDSGMRAKVHRINADIDIWSLFAGNVHFRSLDVTGVKATLPETPKEAPEKSQPASLKPPVNLVFDHVHVGNVHVTRGDKTIFVVRTLDLGGRWTSQGLAVRQLKLRAPKGRADLSGKLALAHGYRGQGQGSFRWKVGDNTWAGKLGARSNGKVARLKLTLTRPATATLRLNLKQKGKFPWRARVEIPRFKTASILKTRSIKTLAVALQGRGDRTGGRLTGHIDLDQTRLDLEPLAIDYDADDHEVKLRQLVLTSPQIKGKLQGHGTIKLATKPAHMDLALQWRDVVMPARLVGQRLASAGHIRLAGSTDKYRLQGKMTLGPPKQVAHLDLDLTGTPEQITLDHLTVKQPHGDLATRGTITLQPSRAWKLTVNGHHFNPGQLLAGWPGSIDLDLATQGKITGTGPDATFRINKLQGKLRQRKLSGHGKLHLRPDRVVDGKLQLASGQSHVAMTATGTHSNHIDVRLAIASLGDWMPGATGAVDGNIKLTGLWPNMAVHAHLTGQKLALDQRRVGTFDLTADVPDLHRPGGTLSLTAGKLVVGSMTFASLELHGKGDAKHHQLHMQAKGEPLSLKLALTGSMHGKAWHGTLSTLNLDVDGIPPWHLEQPSQLAWDRGKTSISRTCLTAGKPVLCLKATRSRQGALDARYRLRDIPVALVTRAAGKGLPLRSQGTIHGDGHIKRSAGGQLSGQATVASDQGSIHYSDRPKLPLLAYRNLAIKADLAPQRQHLTLDADLSHGGGIHGDVRITGKQQALSGRIAMRLDSLAPVELFTSAVANVKGHLDGRFRLGGTLHQPDLRGQARLRDFAAELPAIGIQLHDGEVTVATTGTDQLKIDGSLDSGDGTLKLGGHVGLGSTAPTHLTMHGDKLLAANIPAAKVTVSPNLDIRKNSKGLLLTGKVTVDKANVDLEKLPGRGPHVVQASPDVVVVDEKQEKKKKQRAALPVRADITVDLDHHTHLKGYGLDGHVSGELNVRQAPGKATTGRGQIVIDGTYKAYGQDLVIQHGRLLFASTPVADPGLDIRAVRKLHPNATISDHQVVGLDISGTAQHPVINIFSDPAMPQSDALSYLITGKPLSEVHGGQGNAVNAAAQALGSAAGNLLAKGIGAKLGINASVSSSEALGTSAFTVGKYLSPRLYLSYGVGLFAPGQVITLRYILSRRWNFEAEQATDFSRASFNYRVEK